MHDLRALVDEHITAARAARHGRSAHLLVHDGALRQTVIALVSGSELNEHSTPAAATLHVLRGRVRLTSGGGGTELQAGELHVIPKERHGLLALDDAAVLLTTVTGVA
ncbi:cupin [Streptomyces sp. NPDC058157]|uniref:cupin n=1 Tax=Streptomyces sp. NPDC058157 TaxID=3346360 RepID=UPI0036F08F4C